MGEDVVDHGIVLEPTDDKLKVLINTLGKNLENSLRIEQPDIGDLDVRHNICRKFNGSILLSLVNDYLIPGIQFTIQPLNPYAFRNRTWSFHSVSILKQGDEYIVFDQTSRDPSGDYFYRRGSLVTVSEELEKMFGLDWNLTFQPAINPTLGVASKIETVANQIGVEGKYTYRDIVPPGTESMMIENKAYTSRLGLKYLTTGSMIHPGVRERMTFNYA